MGDKTNTMNLIEKTSETKFSCHNLARYYAKALSATEALDLGWDNLAKRRLNS